MPDNPYERWVREQREAWEANCERQGFAPTDEYWRQWLEVMAFSLIEQAQTLLETAIDPSGAAPGARDEAIDRLISVANSLRVGPAYSTVEWSGDGGAYCDAVEARLAELRSMPYRAYLSSPEWEMQRRTVLRRAGGRCETCNKRANLHVHHRTYERRGDEAGDDLIALFADCHGAVHWHGGAHRPKARAT